MPSRDGDERNGGRVVADLLDESRHLLLDLLETSLRVWGLSGVHLVDTNDQLLDTKGVSEQSVLTGLAVLGDTSLEFTGTGSNDQDTAISLGGSSDHVLEGALAHLLSFLLELLDGTLVDTTALVDQVTGGGGLAGVDVSNDDNVDVSLLGSSHLVGFLKDLRRVKSGSETKWISPGA